MVDSINKAIVYRGTFFPSNIASAIGEAAEAAGEIVQHSLNSRKPEETVVKEKASSRAEEKSLEIPSGIA
jgi:hypothetical protein